MSIKFGSGYKAIQVMLLDGTLIARSIYKNSKAAELVDNLLQMFNVVEKDYFGLYFLSDRERKWLNLKHKIWPQIKHLDPPYQLHFGMQFYPQDVMLLQEEITTYMMFLQTRKDVMEDRLVISEKYRAELCALVLQAEGAVSSSDSYLSKHRSFFVHLQRSSAQFEANILEILYNLSGMDGTLAEANLIERSLVATQYGVEPYPVRSEAHSSLRNLSMALGPTGITIYQERNRLEIFKWNEIWNAGYVEKTFWIRIFREGENSRHKHTLSSSRLCKEVWKSFKKYFKFYVQDHSIPPKVAWGRVAPQVNRANLLQDKGLQLQIQTENPLLPQTVKQSFAVPTTEL